ncbi:MAG: hypothetical protein PUK59_02295 [Actinomycetaceae bacterium]|nr:hypothetical protein [Actinomycetaceae bacterium]
MRLLKKVVCLFVCIPLFVSSSSVAFAQDIATESSPEDAIVFQDETKLVIALTQSSLCLDGDEISQNDPIPLAIGDPYPGNPSAKSCSESIYRYSDVAKVVERLGTSPSALQKMGYLAAVTFLASKIAGPGGTIVSLAFGLVDAIRVHPADWWAQALAKIALGKASYVKRTIYCNYGGGYPAAYSILTLH